jgi:hypothetical protein
MRSFLSAPICTSVVLTSQALGASTEIERGFPQAEAQRFLLSAMRNIHLGKCESGFCAKATAQELKSPPVSIRLTQLALAAGYLSGLAGGLRPGRQFPLLSAADDRLPTKGAAERSAASLAGHGSWREAAADPTGDGQKGVPAAH